MISDRRKEALDRIARSADGAELYGWLQEIVCEVNAGEVSQGALRHQNGRRSLARDLMALMGEGIASGGRHDDTVILKRRDDGDRPRRESVREYLARQPSWVDDPNADDKPAGAGTA